MLRLAAFALLGITVAHACDCVEITVRSAKKRAGIVFRGRITGFRDIGNGHNIVFAVDRVWKGKVPSTFEMPAFKETTACLGFWPQFLEVGTYLLVYAYKLEGAPDYVTDICARTALAEHSQDYAQLGIGYKPKSK